MMINTLPPISADELMTEITPVSTPTDQLSSWPEHPRYGRTASVSSIASSMSNFPMGQQQDFSYQQFASHYKLSDVFERHLYDVYQRYHANPEITPFQINNPPSGVLNRVSKDALITAEEQGMEIGIEINNYSLAIIRQKLIQLCRSSSICSSSSSGTNIIMSQSRNNSVSSVNTPLNNFPTLNLNTKFNQIGGFNQTAPQSPWESRTSMEPQQSGGYFSFEAPPQFARDQIQAPQLQPSFLHEQIQQQQLQEQMKQAEVVIPELFNATSNRKRESLRLKRSGSAVTYN